MFGLVSKLFAGAKKSSPKPTSRLGVEALEVREVLSTSSGAMHAVAPPAGHLTQEITFYIDANDHLLRENSTALNGGKNTPSNVKLLSAGHDARGGAEVFVTAGDGSFW